MTHPFTPNLPGRATFRGFSTRSGIRWVFALLFLLAFSTLHAQPPKLSLAQQTDDFSIFKGSLREGHGGLDYFIRPADFTRACDSVQKTFTEGLSFDAYYLKLRYLLVLLRSGHSRITHPAESRRNFRMAVLANDRLYLPLQLALIDQNLYVRSDCSAEQTVREGSQITRINGRSVRQLLDSMQHYMPADGINTTFKTYNLSIFYHFHFLYNLFYPLETGFTLTLADRAQPVRVKGLRPAAIETAYTKRHKDLIISHFENPTQYKPSVAPQTAYLKIGSFYKGFIETFGVRFESFVDSAFLDMVRRNTRHLIIDLRDNEGGGDNYPEILYSHLTAKPFRTSGMNQVAGRQFRYLAHTVDLSDDLKAYAANPRAYLRDDSTLYLNPNIVEQMDHGNTFWQPSPNRFTGPVYVLINGGSFSATSTFIRYLYAHRQTQPVHFVGEENGGDIFAGAVCAGQSYAIRLPNSGIRVDMPFLCEGELTKRYPKKRLPDYPVSPTVHTLLEGRDDVLQFVLDRIDKPEKGRN